MSDTQETNNATPSTQPASKDVAKVEAAPVFYHLYSCTNEPCVKAANPQRFSVHMRGVYVASPNPVSGVKCPGCTNEMKPVEHGATLEQAKAEKMHETYIIYPAPVGQEESL